MRYFIKVLALLGIVVFCVIHSQAQQLQTSSAAVPRLVKYSSALADSSGQPRAGVAGVTFALYKDQHGGAPLWIETQNVQLDERGNYSVMLGSMTSDGLPLELFSSGESRWLGVQAQVPGAEEQPRVLLVSVPYALKAADAETLGGKPLSSFVLASEDLTARVQAAGGLVRASGSNVLPTAAVTGGTPGTLGKFDVDGTSLVNSVVTENSGNIGVGTGGSPGFAFHVAGNRTDFIGKFDNQSFASSAQGLWVNVNSGDPASLPLKITTSGGGLTPFVITGNGNVGIGTATPTDKLQVESNAETNLLFKTTAVAASTRIKLQPTANGLAAFEGLAGTTLLGSANDLVLATGAGPVDGYTERMRVLATGNVGIGTTTPGATLDVNGNGNFSGNVTVGGTVTASGGQSFGGLTTYTATPTGSGVNQGSLYVNPASAGAGQTLLGVAVNGTQEFKVDSGGSITTAGNINLPNTNGSGTAGVIKLGGNPFLHNYGTQNTFLGQGAGNFSTTGYFNTGIGLEALISNTTGLDNTASGSLALLGNTSGVDNTASGLAALWGNSTGSDNTATGVFTLYHNNGSDNTATGVSALYGNGTGNSNTAFGRAALASNTTGNKNIAAGMEAGVTTNDANANTTGSYNTFIGSYSGPGIPSAFGLQNATAIGANAVVSANNALVLGSINGVNGATSSVNVGIGTATPSATLDVNGNINIPNTASGGTSGVIKFGGNRFLHNFGPANAFNTFVGQGAGNFGISSGCCNTGLGSQTLSGVQTGFSNTATGNNALQFNNSGAGNTATGTNALWNNSSGYTNTATGLQALESNTTGCCNTATGAYSLLSNGNVINTGNANTATGWEALSHNTTGSNNTAVGAEAGYTITFANSNTTGSNNTFLGYNSGPGTTTQLDNATAVGANAVVSANNALVLGSINGVNGATSNVNVGIGTATPGFRLDVQGGQINASVGLCIAGDCRASWGSVSGLGGSGTTNAVAKFTSTNTVGNSLIFDTGSSVGIGTATPAATLQVAGGDAYLSTVATGLILKSPDGTKCARISLDNSGALATTLLTCP